MTDTLLNALQWPAMAVTLISAWLVASEEESRRAWGFWAYLGSNVLWVAWGWHTQSWALVALQFGLAAMNIRGTRKNNAETTS